MLADERNNLRAAMERPVAHDKDVVGIQRISLGEPVWRLVSPKLHGALLGP